MNQIKKSTKKTGNPYSSTTAMAKISFAISIVGVILALTALGLTGWNFKGLLNVHKTTRDITAEMDKSLVKNNAESQATLSEFRHQLQQQDDDQQTMQSAVNQVVQFTNSTGALQQSQQIITLLQMAQIQLNVSQDVSDTLHLVKQASSHVNQLSLANQLTIKNKLSSIASLLKSTPTINIAEIIEKLDSLNKHIATLSFTPKLTQAKSTEKQTEPEKTSRVKGYSLAFWGEIKSLVSIKHYQEPLMPLMDETEQQIMKSYLLQQVSQAQWSVINHNDRLYQLSLDNINSKLQHLVLDQSQLKTIEDFIKPLKSIKVSVDLPNIDDQIDAIITLLNATNDNPPQFMLKNKSKTAVDNQSDNKKATVKSTGSNTKSNKAIIEKDNANTKKTSVSLDTYKTMSIEV